MSTLGHVFEAAGLATIVLASQRPVVERMQPPRSLFCEFPFGRPLGKPNDVDYQQDVLFRAFALLDAPYGPVLVDHPDVIAADETPMSCSLPARFNPDLAPCVEEAQGLRKAYDRCLAGRGVTDMGRAFTADDVPRVLGLLQQIADGVNWKSVDLPGKNTVAIVHDIRAYYDEAALQLVDNPQSLGARSTEAWFFESTEAGKTVMAARAAIKDSGGPFPVWFYMAPAHR